MLPHLPQPPRPRGALSRATLMVAAALIGVAVSTTPRAQAANLTWSSTAGGISNWSEPANWGGGSVSPNAIGDVANLSGALTTSATVNLNGIITLSELNFGGTTGVTGFTLAAGTGGMLILDDTDGTVSINKLNASPSIDTISANIQFNNALTISNNSGGGTLTITGTMRSLTSDITVTGNSTAGATGLGSILTGIISTAGGYIKDGTGTMQTNGSSTYAGTTWIKAGRLIINGGSDIPMRSAITIEAAGILEVKGNPEWGSITGAGNLINIKNTLRTLTIGRNDTSTIFSGTITSTTPASIRLRKIGAGTLTLQPTATNVNTYTGSTEVTGGKLVLDTSSSTLTSAFWAATPLTISGGNFELKGRSGAAVTQTLGAFTLGATGGSITLTPNSGTSTNLVLGAVTAEDSGGTLLITAPSTTTVKLGTPIVSTALNGRAVFSDGTANTFNWATNATNATAVSGFLSSTTLPAVGGGAVGTSYILTAGQNQTTANATIGTLKLSSTSGTTQVLDLVTFNMQLGGGTTKTPGAILIDGTANWNINGTGALAANIPATSPDLIFQHYGSGTLTVNAPIGGGVTSLVKAGPGTMVLAGTNTFTGDIALNGGVLSFGAVGNVANGLGAGVGKAIRIRDGATLRYTGATGPIAAGASASSYIFNLTGGNATIDVATTAATDKLTLSGVISGAGGLTKAGIGILKLDGVNIYTGPTFVTAGTLQAGVVKEAFGSASSPLDISSGATVDINSFNQTIGSLSGAGTVTNSTTTVGTLSAGFANLTTTFTGSFTNGTATGGSAFIKTGNGILILAGSTTSTWTGNHQVNGGVIRLASSNLLANAVKIFVANAAGPAMLELSSGVTQTFGSLTFGGESAAVGTTSQANVLIGSGATLTAAGNVTYTSAGNPLAAYVSGAGGLALSGADRTFTIGDSSTVPSSAAELTVAVPITGSFGIIKNGLGNLLLSRANTFSGATTTLTAGGLILDYTIQNNNKIPDANSLTLNGGGNLVLLGNASANTSQAVLSTTLASGGFSAITLTPGGSQKIVFSMGPLTRNASAGTVRFTLPTGTQDATNGITTTTTNVNGVLGIGAAWATASLANGETNFAVNNGTNNIGLLASATKDDVTTWAAGDHVTDSTGYTGTTTVATNVHTLRFNSSSTSTVTLGANLSLSVLTGGILQTAGAANAFISGGRLTSGTSNELIFTTDVAAAALTVSSTISGTETITKTGRGMLKLTGTNNYTGKTYLQGGTLQVSGGNAIGDNSSVLFRDGRASVLELLNSETIGTLETGGSNGTSGASEIRLGVNTLTINQGADGIFSGAVVGAGTLLKTGASVLGYQSNAAFSGSTFTGTLQIDQGMFALSGNFLQFATITAVILNGPTSVLQNNQDQASSKNRLNDAATVLLNNTAGGSGLSLTKSISTEGLEVVGALTLGAGHNVITATSLVAVTGQWTFASLSTANSNHSTALVRGASLGSDVTTTRGVVFVTSTPSGAYTAVGTTEGGVIGTTKNLKIIPFFVGDVTAAGLGNSFVTNNATTYGFRPLAPAEYGQDLAVLVAGDNTRYTTSTAITTLATINTLVLDSVTGIALTAVPNGTLTVTAGAILATGAASHSIADSVTGLATSGAARDYTIFVTDPACTLTIASQLTTFAPLVKSGAGALVLTSAISTFTDLYLNQGTFHADAPNKLGSGILKFFGGTLKFDAAFDATFGSKLVLIGTGGAVFDTNGNNVSFANAIGNSGFGGITKNGNGTLTLTGANTYTGATTVNGGTLLINGSTSNTSLVTVGANGTLGGMGTVGGNTTISGIHSTGNSPGIQTFTSNLSYVDAGTPDPTVNWKLASNTTTVGTNPTANYDQIIVSGNLEFTHPTYINLSFNGAGSTVLWSDSLWDSNQSWLLYDVTGLGTTTNIANLNLVTVNWLDSGSNPFSTAGGSFTLGQSGEDVILNFTAVPEPSTYGFGLGALALAAAAIRRRKRQAKA